MSGRTAVAWRLLRCRQSESESWRRLAQLWRQRRDRPVAQVIDLRVTKERLRPVP
jgi:hypothetical protein